MSALRLPLQKRVATLAPSSADYFELVAQGRLVPVGDDKSNRYPPMTWRSMILRFCAMFLVIAHFVSLSLSTFKLSSTQRY